ncbi:MAG: hypothetical protein ABI047_02120 [Jatrophihabitantaceae bacterium]
MRFDNEQSPSYYAAMSRAFETYVAKSDGHELTCADYDAMHLAVTRDTLSKNKHNTFKAVPHKLSAQDIQYPMTKGEFPNPEALVELRDQGTLGLDAKRKVTWSPASMSMPNWRARRPSSVKASRRRMRTASSCPRPTSAE